MCLPSPAVPSSSSPHRRRRRCCRNVRQVILSMIEAELRSSETKSIGWRRTCRASRLSAGVLIARPKEITINELPSLLDATIQASALDALDVHGLAGDDLALEKALWLHATLKDFSSEGIQIGDLDKILTVIMATAVRHTAEVPSTILPLANGQRR
jgi:hypothetical protein